MKTVKYSNEKVYFSGVQNAKYHVPWLSFEKAGYKYLAGGQPSVKDRPIRASPTQWSLATISVSMQDFGTLKHMLNVPLNDHTDISSRATGLNFGPGLYLHPYFVYSSCECSCKTYICPGICPCSFEPSLLICDTYQNLGCWPIWWQKPNKMDSNAVVRSGEFKSKLIVESTFYTRSLFEKLR